MANAKIWTLRSAWLLMLAFCLFLGGFTFIYFNFRHDVFFLKEKGLLVFDPVWRTMFYIHITASTVAVVTGPFQFIPSLRRRYLKTHRRLGRAYAISILFLGGPTGLYMAFFANGGFWACLGFFILSILWIGSTGLAMMYAIRRDIRQHREWMIRSFAFTFSAVTLRTWVPALSAGLGVDPDLTVILTAWINWIPNLLIAEIIIRKALRYT